MQILVKHATKGRLRIKIVKKASLSYEEIAQLQVAFPILNGLKKLKYYSHIGELALYYDVPQTKEALLHALSQFQFQEELSDEAKTCLTGIELNDVYKKRLFSKTFFHFTKKILLPASLNYVLGVYGAIPYLLSGLKSLYQKRIDVALLDASAIGISILRNDIPSASNIMYLLGIGELLEEWTHKKSIDDLAKNMAINVDNVWLRLETGEEVLLPLSSVKENDVLVLRMGGLIPIDGTVLSGEAMVNQATLTGESIPVVKNKGKSVYAGTVVEEGAIDILVDKPLAESRYARIVNMIEESEKLKSNVQSSAEKLADKLVPFSFLGAIFAFLLTRNLNKALAFLMVDFSCALKLAIPLSVLSAMKEAASHSIVIKGGKFLEACAEADTIVFDKTGTLTKASPVVHDVITLDGNDKREMLRIAACLEEHFPHSVARAVVNQAKIEGLTHEEMHSEVEYIIAHGIASTIDNKRVLIGSYHFIFEDEAIPVTEEEEAILAALPAHFSHLYMAIDHKLSAILLIEDPIREEAPAMIKALKAMGIRPVMMTGDSYRTAKAVAEELGFEEFFAEVLPEDKANFVQAEKAKNKKVIMIGDGVNDSPALSASDAGIAMQDSSSLAREISDITISSNDLMSLVTLIEIARSLMKRIKFNYRTVTGFNGGLIALGFFALITPGSSALLHNGSTLVLALNSMTPLLKER